MKVGGSVFRFNSVGRKSVPKWRVPAVFLDTDDTGVAAKFRGQTLKAARLCAREGVGPKDVGKVWGC